MTQKSLNLETERQNLSLEQADAVIRTAAFLAKRAGPKDMPMELRQQQMLMARAQASADLAMLFDVDIPKGKFTEKVEAERGGQAARDIG